MDEPAQSLLLAAILAPLDASLVSHKH